MSARKDTAAGAKVGDLVTSRWSSSGAVWRVEEVGEEVPQYFRSGRRLMLRALTSNRTREGWENDLRFMDGDADAR